jgi:hypothetical protein
MNFTVTLAKQKRKGKGRKEKWQDLNEGVDVTKSSRCWWL